MGIKIPPLPQCMRGKGGGFGVICSDQRSVFHIHAQERQLGDNELERIVKLRIFLCAVGTLCRLP